MYETFYRKTRKCCGEAIKKNRHLNLRYLSGKLCFMIKDEVESSRRKNFLSKVCGFAFYALRINCIVIVILYFWPLVIEIWTLFSYLTVWKIICRRDNCLLLNMLHYIPSFHLSLFGMFLYKSKYLKYFDNELDLQFPPADPGVRIEGKSNDHIQLYASYARYSVVGCWSRCNIGRGWREQWEVCHVSSIRWGHRWITPMILQPYLSVYQAYIINN